MDAVSRLAVSEGRRMEGWMLIPRFVSGFVFDFFLAHYLPFPCLSPAPPFPFPTFVFRLVSVLVLVLVIVLSPHLSLCLCLCFSVLYQPSHPPTHTRSLSPLVHMYQLHFPLSLHFDLVLVLTFTWLVLLSSSLPGTFIRIRLSTRR